MNTFATRCYSLVLFALLLAGCAAPELESNALAITAQPTKTVPSLTVEPLVAVTATQTATSVATATPPNTATPLPTAMPTDIPPTDSPSSTPTSTPTTPPTVTPDVQDVATTSAETIKTVTPLPATQILPTAVPAATDAPKRGGIAIPASLTDLVNQILADAEKQTGTARDAIEVTSIEEVTWRSGAMGCPQPGYAYTQALVDGHRILLNANGLIMPYHTSRTAFIYCNPEKSKAEQPLPPSGGATGDE